MGPGPLQLMAGHVTALLLKEMVSFVVTWVQLLKEMVRFVVTALLLKEMVSFVVDPITY